MKGHTYKRCPCGVLRDHEGRRINCQKKHGSWYYAHEVPASPQGKRRQTFRGGFPTEREARQALNRALAAVSRVGYVEPTRLTVGEYLEVWLSGKARLRSNTRRSYRGHLDLYLKPGLGHLRLVELRDVHIERLYAALPLLGRTQLEPDSPEELHRLLSVRSGPAPVRPMGPTSIRRVHATLMSALNTAVKRKLIDANPAAHVELPSGRRPRAVVWTPERIAAWRRTGVRPAVAVWTPDQAGRFLDAAARERLYPLFHLIAYRGLRRGEAVGLRWEDVHFAGRSLTVTQQVVQLGWATEVGEPKTDTGTRTVSLDDDTLRVLRQWQETQEAEARTWGAAWTDTGLVFTREDGSGLHPASVTDLFQAVYAKAELSPIRLHDLRHTAASLALQAGVPMKVVSEQLGHSSLAITADTYTSVLPAVAQAAAEAVAGIVPRTRPTIGALVTDGPPSSRTGAADEEPSAAALAVRWQFGPENDSGRPPRRVNALVRGGAPSGTRTPNPLIKREPEAFPRGPA
jgi:integrase